METIKKIMLSVLVILGINITLTRTCIGMNEPFYYTDSDEALSHWKGDNINESTEIGNLVKINSVEPEESLLNRALAIFNLDDNHNDKYTGPQKALAYAKYLLNYAMAFVSFIALCLLIYSFYCVIIGDQKQIETAKSYLKGIAIAIMVMGVSWFITSMIIRLYDDVAKDSEDTLIAALIFINSIA